MGFPAGVTVTVVYNSPSGVDRWNNAVMAQTTEDVSGVAGVPMQTSESAQGAEEVLGSGQFYFKNGLAGNLDYLSEVLFNGKTYQIQGDPEQWTSPWSGLSSPLRVDVREVTGAAAHSSSESGG
jgi:hypothetical protein